MLKTASLPRSLLFAVVATAGCANTTSTFDDGGTSDGATGCAEGSTRCEGNVHQRCGGGAWRQLADCGEGFCEPERGCLACAPSTKYCVGDDPYQCSADGNTQTRLAACPEDRKCVLGECASYCDLLGEERSNVGCEFWAVDLPNEYSFMTMPAEIYFCAACQQFAVAVANTSRNRVQVSIDLNEAPPGAPLQLRQVTQKELGPESLEVFNLPMREVDCTEWKTDDKGRLRRQNDSQSCISSRAFRIKSSYPVVAYQFNPIINQASNGASLLIPKTGLDLSYYVMSWETTNPIKLDLPRGGAVMEGIPDFMNVTIVGIEPDTEVEVTLAHQISASPDGKIPAAKKGETIKLSLGPYDVANLSSLQDETSYTGDFTGTLVRATRPVVVFSGGQRSEVPIGDVFKKYDPVPPQPSETKTSYCCTEHFEQQMFPISSLGSSFAITRTPIRCVSWPEPDFYRILATKDGTSVVTNLSDFPALSLNAGQVANFWSKTDFIVEASAPVMIAQYAVAQDYLDCDPNGDPEFIVFPPVAQHRKDYIFLTPATFINDYVVIATPETATVKLDEQQVSDEFDTRCDRRELGWLDGKHYVALHCPLADGVHRVVASDPVGITVYGYNSVSSYGYPGGADIRRINIE